MKPTVYIETTIPSYLVARPSRDIVLAGQQESTREWWDTRCDGFELFTSPYVLDEASKGESLMAEKRLDSLRDAKVLVPNERVEQLAIDLYLKLGLPEKAKTDAYHIAIAAAYGMDFFLTWNCTHINNLQLMHRIESICREAGFVAPVIGTPEELQ